MEPQSTPESAPPTRQPEEYVLDQLAGECTAVGGLVSYTRVQEAQPAASPSTAVGRAGRNGRLYCQYFSNKNISCNHSPIYPKVKKEFALQHTLLALTADPLKRLQLRMNYFHVGLDPPPPLEMLGADRS